MGRYDGWGRDPRRASDGGYDQGWRRPPPPWQRPHWWGDREDPRYAGFDLPPRYGQEYTRQYQGPGGRDMREPTDGADFSRYGRLMDDRELENAVRRRLFEDTSLRADGIQVEAEDGVVTLSGRVSDYLEARYAWDDAWETDGVRGVVSRIEVGAGEGGASNRPPTDEEASE